MANGKRKVVVRITSDTKGLVAGLTKAEASLGNFAKTGRAASNVAGKQIAIAGVAAATAITAIYAATAPAVAQLKELAQVGDTTVKMFQRQAFAAKTVGIEQEKYADILKDMKDRVGDFLQTGGGPMADFFEKIAPKVGVTAQEFKNLSGPQALQLFVSSLEKANLSQSEMTFYMEAIASDSTRLIPLLRNGGAEMKRLGDAAEQTGYVLSEMDVEKVKAAQESFDEAKAAAEGLLRRITVQLAPAVEFLGDMFVEASKESGGFKDETAKGFEFLIEAAALAANAIRGFQVIFKGLHLVAAGFGSVVTSTFELVGKVLLKSAEGWNMMINDLIAAANMIPGVDIPLIDSSGLETARKFLTALGESGRENVGIIRAELHDLMMEPLPGDELKKKLEEAYRAANEAARNAAADNDSNDDGGGEDPLTDAQKAEMETFRQSLLTKEEQEMEHYARRLEMFKTYGAQLFETEAERKAALQEIEKEHQDALTQIANQGNEQRARVANMSWGQQAKFAADTFTQLTAGAAQHSRKMFEINKAAGIAQTIINTYSAATGAYNALAGIPIVGPALGAAAAATAIAAGLMNVRAIKNSKFGGGAVPSQAPTPPVPTRDVGAGSGGGGSDGPRGMATVNLHGNNFSRESVMQLGEQMNELAKDGFEFQFAKG